MARTVRFTVGGRGAFPFDMLRYANAWPATSVDVLEMQREDRPRKVTLETDRGLTVKGQPIGPTIADRFASFGWPVITADGLTYDLELRGFYDPAKLDELEARIAEAARKLEESAGRDA